MQFDPQLNALFLEPDFWYLVGISLIIADIFLGLNFFALKRLVPQGADKNDINKY